MRYGPQTTAIENLINRVKYLTPEQVRALGDNDWKYNYGVRCAVRDELRNADREILWDKTWCVAWAAGEDVLWGNSRNIARDAILALFARDLISEADFNILYGPWAAVMDGSTERT